MPVWHSKLCHQCANFLGSNRRSTALDCSETSALESVPMVCIGQVEIDSVWSVVQPSHALSQLLLKSTGGVVTAWASRVIGGKHAPFINAVGRAFPHQRKILIQSSPRPHSVEIIVGLEHDSANATLQHAINPLIFRQLYNSDESKSGWVMIHQQEIILNMVSHNKRPLE